MVAASAVLVTLLLAADGAVSPGGGGPAAPTARLEVHASPDCATREALVARVAARSPRIEFVDDRAALTVRATLDQRGASVAAELVFAGAGARPWSRRLLTRSCAEAADALALIIAVTLDPASAFEGGAGNGRQTAVRSVAAPTATPTATPSLVAAAAGPADRPPANVERRSAQAEGALDSPSPSRPVAAHRRLGAEVALQTVSGLAPRVMPGVAAYVIAGLDRPSPWSPAVILGLSHTWRTGLSEPDWGGTAAFVLDAASLDVCALRLRLWAVEARACGTLLAGRLVASGSDTYLPVRAVRPLLSAGGALVVSAPIGSVLEFGARLGAGWSLVRDSFEFSPNVFHRVAPLAVGASVGVGARLW